MGLNLAGKAMRVGRRAAWRARRWVSLRKTRVGSPVVNGLKRCLRGDPNFFQSLKPLYAGCKVRIFEFEGKKYAVKDTLFDSHEGYDVKAYQRVFREHDRIIKENPELCPSDLYVFSPIKVYGMVGPLLVMELKEKADYIPSKDFEPLMRALEETNPGAAKRLMDAVSQLEFNIQMLGRNSRVRGRQIQLRVWGGGESVVDILGNTNPAHLEKGRWILSLPFDAV
ncbi:MAG: hypothetical protein V1493_03425 [Candidatus Diapherotrites archaeon]